MGVSSILQNRIVNPFKGMILDWKNKEYRIGLFRFLSLLLKDLPATSYLSKKLNLLIVSKLETEFSDILNKYQAYNEETHYNPESVIWVSWQQGYDDAPTLVKKCINSIKNSTNHKVILLTNDNISDYVDLPDYIYEKYNKGTITNAQFSDILRMSLLAQRGGLWIDATVFVPDTIPEDVFKQQFYTCKRNINNSSYVSQYRWTSFLNGCQKGCVIQKAMMDLFLAYWKDKNYLIDYLLVDFFMLIIYENIPKAKQLIDDLQYNNSKIERLQELMNEPFNAEEYDRLMNSEDTFMFKLSWRMNFKEKTVDGRDTYYGRFINNLI